MVVSNFSFRKATTAKNNGGDAGIRTLVQTRKLERFLHV